MGVKAWTYFLLIFTFYLHASGTSVRDWCKSIHDQWWPLRDDLRCRPLQEGKCICTDRLITSEQTVDAAKALCEETNGYLAVIDNPKMLFTLNVLFYDMNIAGQMYVGLEKVNDVWQWITPSGSKNASNLNWRRRPQEEHKYGTIFKEDQVMGFSHYYLMVGFDDQYFDDTNYYYDLASIPIPCFEYEPVEQIDTPCVDEIKQCAQMPSTQCKKNTYKGNRSVTVSGKICQHWNHQEPHSHYFAHLGKHNQCRNPDGDSGPWCYTTDPSHRYELCFVACEEETIDECVDEEKQCAWHSVKECRSRTESYNGTKSTTVSGRTCQEWSKQEPHKHHMEHLGNNSYCRNPDKEPGPWCYTTETNKRFELCFEDCQDDSNQCVDEEMNCANWYSKQCKDDEYQGQQSITLSGRLCQKWSDQTPHEHGFATVGDHNYCRNPQENEGAPWCYTMDKAYRFEYCFANCARFDELHTNYKQYRKKGSGKDCLRYYYSGDTYKYWNYYGYGDEYYSSMAFGSTGWLSTSGQGPNKYICQYDAPSHVIGSSLNSEEL